MNSSNCVAGSTGGRTSVTLAPAALMASTARRSTSSIARSPGFSGSSSHTAMRRPAIDGAPGGGSSMRHAGARAGSGPASTDISRSRSPALRGHRPEHVDVGVGGAAADAVEVAALGDDAVARLEPERPAAVRGQAHRAADVGAQLERGQPGGHGGGRAARRAARDAGDVPRVVRRAEDLVEALQVTRPAGQVGLAEDDRAGFLEPSDGRRVGGRHVIGQLDRAAGRADAGGLDGVLDRDRQAVQRRQRRRPTPCGRRPRRRRPAPARRRASRPR